MALHSFLQLVSTLYTFYVNSSTYLNYHMIEQMHISFFCSKARLFRHRERVRDSGWPKSFLLEDKHLSMNDTYGHGLVTTHLRILV